VDCCRLRRLVLDPKVFHLLNLALAFYNVGTMAETPVLGPYARGPLVARQYRPHLVSPRQLTALGRRRNSPLPDALDRPHGWLLGPVAGTAWAGSGGSGQPLPCKDLKHALGALSSRQCQLLVLLLWAITVLSSRFRSGCSTHSNGHCERQRSNLGPLSARWVEIASSRRARLAMTAPI
jgi:hypothetical protein